MDRPFFYRLSDPQPVSLTGDFTTIKETICEEIQRIVSTRTNVSLEGDRNIFNYGIPHISESYSDGASVASIAKYIEHSIESFEPRIKSVKVEVSGRNRYSDAKYGVSATVWYEDKMEKFTVDINS